MSKNGSADGGSRLELNGPAAGFPRSERPFRWRAGPAMSSVLRADQRLRQAVELSSRGLAESRGTATLPVAVSLDDFVSFSKPGVPAWQAGHSRSGASGRLSSRRQSEFRDGGLVGKVAEVKAVAVTVSAH